MNALVPVVVEGLATIATTLSSLFGGGEGRHPEIIHVQDPALVELLRSMESQRASFLSQINEIEEDYNCTIDRLRVERNDVALSLREQRTELDRLERGTKEAFNLIIETATAVLLEATNPVDVLLGAQGSGKSTIANQLYGIPDALPGEGVSHVTTENTIHRRSDGGGRPLVDTIGSQVSLPGMIRVLACLLCNGMNPESLIIVHNGRVGTVANLVALFGGKQTNSITFDSRTFWRVQTMAQADDGNDATATDTSINQFIFVDPSLEVTQVNQIVNASTPLVSSDLRARLIHALGNLDYHKFKNAAGNEKATFGIVFYFAKTIAERHTYTGSDLNFLNMVV